MRITELYGVLLNTLIKYRDLEIECRNPAGDLADIESVVKREVRRADGKKEDRLVISPYTDEEF